MANGRCRLHGGLSTGPRSPAAPLRTHGIYDKAVTAEEAELWNEARAAELDNDIALQRVIVRRAAVKMREVEDDPGSNFELERIEEEKADVVGDGDRSSNGLKTSRQRVIRARPDFHAIHDRALARLVSLERLRLDKDKSGALEGGSIEEAARKWREALDALENSVPRPRPEDEEN
jgi:hypothetical protein